MIFTFTIADPDDAARFQCDVTQTPRIYTRPNDRNAGPMFVLSDISSTTAEDEARASLPTRTDFFGPILYVLMESDTGHMSLHDILEGAYKRMGMTAEQRAVPKQNAAGKNKGSELYNRGTWALTEMQHIGDVQNISRGSGIWEITYQGRMKTMAW
jgi:Mrr N-terminal domain